MLVLCSFRVAVVGVPSTMDLLYVTVECVPASVDFPARLSLATPTELPLQMGGPSPALPWEGTEKVPFFYDQNGKCLRFVTSLSANRLNKAKIDR